MSLSLGLFSIIEQNRTEVIFYVNANSDVDESEKDGLENALKKLGEIIIN